MRHQSPAQFMMPSESAYPHWTLSLHAVLATAGLSSRCTCCDKAGVYIKDRLVSYRTPFQVYIRRASSTDAVQNRERVKPGPSIHAASSRRIGLFHFLNVKTLRTAQCPRVLKVRLFASGTKREKARAHEEANANIATDRCFSEVCVWKPQVSPRQNRHHGRPSAQQGFLYSYEP